MGAPEDIGLMEKSLSELVIKYEQYFLGLEKREPVKLLGDIEQLARRYQNIKIVNSMLNFKYNSLVAKLNSYKQHWNRINRLIEDGKYSRDKFKAEMHHHSAPAASNSPATPEPREPKASPEVEAVYQQYLQARKACALPVENVNRETIAAALAKQKPAIINKYNCANVEFKVVIEDGTPKIKARPKS
jgi:hypothetical protein